MNNKVQHLVDKVQSPETLNVFLDVLATVTHLQTVNNVPPEKWGTLQRLAVKILYHARTIKVLIDGYKFYLPSLPNSLNNPIYDFQSVVVLCRTMLEAYLHLYDIYIDSEHEDETRFRQLAFEIKGFLIREDKKDTFSPKFANELARTQVELEELKQFLEKNAYFKSLSPKKRKDALRGNKFAGRKKLNIPQQAQNAGLKLENIELLYAFQSGYVHVDSLSLAHLVSMQIEDQRRLLNHQALFVNCLIARVIGHYCEIFDFVSENLKEQSDCLWLLSVAVGIYDSESSQNNCFIRLLSK